MTPIPDNLPIEITDRYDIANNTFIGKDKGEKHDELEVEIGDIHSDTFRPHFKIKRWDNECNFSVRLIDDAVDVPTLQTDHNIIKFVKQGVAAHFYDVPKTDGMPECYEFEIVLKKKPKTNKVQMSVETKGLLFYYQSELTQKEKDRGASRPENVVGSYAVYHESKAGDYSKLGLKNYRAGKAFHIYRPKIIDNAGKEVWGPLNIDIENKLLTITIPQEFLNNAVYPVIVDPTFGQTSTGETSYGDSSDYMLSVLDTPASGGTLESVSIYIVSGTFDDGPYIGFLYESTGALVAQTAVVTSPPTNQWATTNFTTTPAITTQEYAIGAWFEEWSLKYDDTSAPYTCREMSHNYPGLLPDPWTGYMDDSSFCYSIYGTYSAGPAGKPLWYYEMLKRRDRQ